MRLILILTLLLQQTLFAADVIGKIIALEGSVSALSESGSRILSRNSDIFLKETVIVGEASRAQILFTDGGLMNLIPDTEFRVNTYRYKKMLQKDQSSSELLKGGFRLLSGSIAKKNPNEYDFKTPSATIGLRGTIIEMVLDGPSLFVGVEQGKALVTNEAGSQMIGIGETNQFVLVPGNTVPAVLILKRPQELERSLFVPPEGGLSIDQVQKQQSQPNIQAAPPSQTRGGTETRPSGGGEEAAPSISETPDEGSNLFQPTGGGASIQGGC